MIGLRPIPLFNRFKQAPVLIFLTLVALLTPVSGNAAPLCARLWMTSEPLKANEMNYQIMGAEHEGPPIVLIHGVGSSLRTFDGVAEQLAHSHKVISYDLRGHGRTKDPINGFEIETLSRDLETLLTNLGIKEFHVLGHSAGGKIAMSIAERNPQRVLSTILEDVGPTPMSTNSLAEYRETEHSVQMLRKLRKIYFSSAHLTQELAPLFPNDLPKAKELAKKVLPVGTRESAVTKQIWYEFKTTDTTSFLQKFKGPTLFLRAQPATRYLSDKDVALIKSQMPSAKIVDVVDGTHSIHSRKPEVFVQEVLEFLK